MSSERQLAGGGYSGEQLPPEAPAEVGTYQIPDRGEFLDGHSTKQEELTGRTAEHIAAGDIPEEKENHRFFSKGKILVGVGVAALAVTAAAITGGLRNNSEVAATDTPLPPETTASAPAVPGASETLATTTPEKEAKTLETAEFTYEGKTFVGVGAEGGIDQRGGYGIFEVNEANPKPPTKEAATDYGRRLFNNMAVATNMEAGAGSEQFVDEATQALLYAKGEESGPLARFIKEIQESDSRITKIDYAGLAGDPEKIVRGVAWGHITVTDKEKLERRYTITLPMYNVYGKIQTKGSAAIVPFVDNPS